MTTKLIYAPEDVRYAIRLKVIAAMTGREFTSYWHSIYFGEITPKWSMDNNGWTDSRYWEKRRESGERV
jgi:hypothetical protein